MHLARSSYVWYAGSLTHQGNVLPFSAWVECDEECHGWFHNTCVGFGTKEIDQEPWFCVSSSSVNNKLNRKIMAVISLGW